MRANIVLDNKILQQMNSSEYLGCGIAHERYNGGNMKLNRF